MEFERLNKIASEELQLSLDIKDKGSVPDLNSVPLKQLEIAKRFKHPFVIEAYLNFLLPEKDWKYIRAFVHQVVLGDRDAKTWRKGRMLSPDVSLKDQLTKTKEEILGEYIHEVQFIMKPDFYNWSQGATGIGGFVFPEPDADYTSLIPKGFLPSEMALTHLVKIDKANIDVLFRRWIAVRITSFLRAKNLLNSFEYSDALEAIAPRSSWTKDAHIALEGLLKEKESGIWKDDTIPGYSGPDEFYK